MDINWVGWRLNSNCLEIAREKIVNSQKQSFLCFWYSQYKGYQHQNIGFSLNNNHNVDNECVIIHTRSKQSVIRRNDIGSLHHLDCFSNIFKAAVKQAPDETWGKQVDLTNDDESGEWITVVVSIKWKGFRWWILIKINSFLIL